MAVIRTKVALEIAFFNSDCVGYVLQFVLNGRVTDKKNSDCKLHGKFGRIFFFRVKSFKFEL